MSSDRIAADVRDSAATDRDDAADRRDGIARDRDDAATQRDADARERDDTTRQDIDDLDESLRRVFGQVLDCLARIENAAVDPDDWPELTPAVLARLDAYTAAQRRLAAGAHIEVANLLDDLRRSLAGLRHGRGAAARDRRHAAGDRQGAAGDRHDSGQDRDAAERDRNQAAIDREQVDPRELPPHDAGRRAPQPRFTPEQEQLNSRMAEAMSTSGQRIDDSRATLDAARASLRRRPVRPDHDDRSPEPED